VVTYTLRPFCHRERTPNSFDRKLGGPQRFEKKKIPCPYLDAIVP